MDAQNSSPSLVSALCHPQQALPRALPRALPHALPLFLPISAQGARICFLWCCELPGNAFSERKLKNALSHFPQLAHDLVRMRTHCPRAHLAAA